MIKANSNKGRANKYLPKAASNAQMCVHTTMCEQVLSIPCVRTTMCTMIIVYACIMIIVHAFTTGWRADWGVQCREIWRFGGEEVEGPGAKDPGAEEPGAWGLWPGAWGREAWGLGPPRQFFFKTSQEQKSQRQFFVKFKISICLFLRQILDKF